MTGMTEEQRQDRGFRREKQAIVDRAEQTRKAFIRFMRAIIG